MSLEGEDGVWDSDYSDAWLVKGSENLHLVDKA